MCSDFKSPMLQVLSNTSLKVFFSTTPNFCLGVYGPPPPRPPSASPPTLQSFFFLESQKRCFLAFCQAVCITTDAVTAKFEEIFGCPPLLNPTFFLFDPPLKHVFFHGPPSNLTSNPPYLIILERSLRRFILLIRYCIHETKLQQHLLLLILLIIN